MYTLRQFMKDVVGMVTSEYELTETEFNRSHSENATDARIAVVGLLVREGWSELEISKALGWSKQRVNWLKNHLDDRMKRRGFRLMWEGITELLR